MRPENDVNYAANPYGFPPKRDRQPLFSKGLILTVAAVALFGGGATAYFTLVKGGSLSGPPPILEPDPTPNKSRPPEAAANDVDPNARAMEDRLVYERLSGTPRATVERLLPPPEQPIPRPIVVPEPKDVPPVAVAAAPVAAPATASPSSAAPQTSVTVAPPSAGNAPPPSTARSAASAAPTPAAAPAAAKPAPTAPVMPPVAPAAAPPVVKVIPPMQQPPTQLPPTQQQPPQNLAALIGNLKPLGVPPPVVTLPASGGGNHWRIQLASVHSEAEAAAEWKRLVSRHPDALGGLSMQIAKADLGEKGVYYRVQGGSVDEARARAICDQLKSQNVGCVVVRP